MTYEEISERIRLHQYAYENLYACSFEKIMVPAFRITRPELKIIFNKLKEMKMLPENDECTAHYDDISYFMGVELEIVTFG